MMLRKKMFVVNEPKLSPGTNLLLGTPVKVSLDNTWPIEEILVFVNVTCGATGPTLTGADNLLGIVKKIGLSINDNNQPRSIVDFTGVGMLEYVQHAGMTLDSATLNAVGLCQGASIANNLNFRICYRIPLVHPAIGEPLRSRMLLPVHTWNQQPVLTLEFEQAANMYSAGSVSAVSAEVVLIRRNMNAADTAAIFSSGGFLSFDLIETAAAIPVGQAGDVRIAVNGPGSYLNLLMRQYKGGATITRAELDETTTVGSETKWRLESGGVAEHEWRWKHLKAINDFSQAQNSANQTYSPVIGGTIAANTSYSPSVSTMLDFLDDGIPGDGVTELGSVLDVNTPLRSGLKMEIVGRVASVATNGSTLYVGGHRVYGDLSQWQAKK